MGSWATMTGICYSYFSLEISCFNYCFFISFLVYQKVFQLKCLSFSLLILFLYFVIEYFFSKLHTHLLRFLCFNLTLTYMGLFKSYLSSFKCEINLLYNTLSMCF